VRYAGTLGCPAFENDTADAVNVVWLFGLKDESSSV
jgi:hypothetical protein